MELNEAIAHAREVAKDKRELAKTICPWADDGEETLNECIDSAINYEHLAEWLTELQERREQDTQENETYKRGYQKGLKVGKRIGAREERKTIIAYLEGKTREEEEIEQMIKNGEVEAIPYLGETAEEEPKT